MAKVFISIGSNVDRDVNFINGLNTLIKLFPNYRHSSVFESEAVGFRGNPFYNSVFFTETDMALNELCVLLKQLERENGRKASDKKFSPRTLDLDILLYDDLVCDEPAQLPRHEIVKNAFVLQPLAELAPDLIHPVTKQTMAQMWSEYDKSQQKLWKVELPTS